MEFPFIGNPGSKRRVYDLVQMWQGEQTVTIIQQIARVQDPGAQGIS